MTRPLGLRLLSCLGLLLCLGACFAPRLSRSIFPPPDFFLEMEAGVNSADGVFSRQKLSIWSDGLVIYREAAAPNLTSKVEGAVGLPVYKWVSAYELAPESTRALSRLLHLAGVLEIPAAGGTARGAQGQWLTVFYRAQKKESTILVQNRVQGPMNRVLDIVNSFLPDDHPFIMPEMVDTGEESHVFNVPPVTESVAGAMGLHRDLLVGRFSSEAAAADPRVRNWRLQLQRDAFALACVNGDIQLAQDCFKDLAAALEDPEDSAKTLFPEVADVDHVEHLRQIMAMARKKARPGN